MGGMIGDRKLFLNNAAYHWAGPDTGCESIGHGATIKDVDQLLPLALGQAGRTTGPVAFQYSFQAILAPPLQPDGNVDPVHLEDISNLRRRPAFHIEDHGLEPTGHPIGSCPKRLFAEAHQSFDCFGMATKLNRAHGIPSRGSCYVM